MAYWVDYGGQDVTGFDAIGTDALTFPLREDTDIPATIAELERRCGKRARIKLFRLKDTADAAR